MCFPKYWLNLPYWYNRATMKSEGTPGQQGPILHGRAANFGLNQFRHEQSRKDMYGMTRVASEIGMGVERAIMSFVPPDHLERRRLLRDDLAGELLPQVNKIKNDNPRPHRGGTTQTVIDGLVVGAYARLFEDGKQNILELADLIDLDHGTRFLHLVSQVDNIPNQFGDHIRHHILEGLLASADPNRVLGTFMAPGYALVPNVVIAAPHTTAREDARGNIQMDAVLIPEAGIGQFGTIYDYMTGTEDPDMHVIELKAPQRVRDGMYPSRRPADTTKNLGQMRAMMVRLLLRQYYDHGRGDARKCPIFPLPNTMRVVYARGLFEPILGTKIPVDAAFLNDCAAHWKEPGQESRVLQKLILSQAQKREKNERRTIFSGRKRQLPAPSSAAASSSTRKPTTSTTTRR